MCLLKSWPCIASALAVLPKGKNKQQEPNYLDKIKIKVIPFFTPYLSSNSPTEQDESGRSNAVTPERVNIDVFKALCVRLCVVRKDSPRVLRGQRF